MKTIFINGLGQNPLSWDKTIFYMRNKIESYCIELFNSIHNKDYTYSNLYTTLLRDLNNTENNLNLCGISLGSVIALNYAIDNPTKVNSLILIAPQYKVPKNLIKFQNIIFKLMPKYFFKNFEIDKKQIIQLTNSMIDLNFTKKLNNISCPVLIICGEKDIANKKASKSLNTIIKNSEIKFIKNANHEVNIDKPKELAKIIDEFYYKQKIINI